MARSKGIASFSANFEAQLSAPIDARMNVPTKAELLLPTTWEANDGGNYTYIGMIVAVAADGINNGLYMLTAADYTNSDNWLQVGGANGGDSIVPLENIVAVEPTLSEITGRRYQSIANALVYIATQTPATDNRWGVMVSGENSESFSVPAWVSIIGQSGMTRLTGAINSAGFNSADQYQYSIFNCVLTNVALNASGLTFWNCYITGGTTVGLSRIGMTDCFISGGNYGSCQTFTAFRCNFVTTGGATFPSAFSPSMCVISGTASMSGIDAKNCNLNSLQNVTFNAGTYNIYDSRIQGNFTIPASVTMKLFNTSGISTVTVDGGALETNGAGGDLTIVVTSGTWDNDGDKYDNRASGLTATEMQGAIDELALGGGTDIIDVTYAELVSHMGASTLIKGKLYKITDYQTKHVIPQWPTTVVNTGAVEELIVMSTDVDKIDMRAYSLDRPQDVIFYDYTSNVVVGPTSYGYYEDGVDQGQPTTISNVTPLTFEVNTQPHFDNNFYVYCWDSSGNEAYYNQNSVEGVDFTITDMGAGQWMITCITVTGPLDMTDPSGNGIECEFSTVEDTRNGWIKRRIDAVKEIDMPYDFMGVKYRRCLIDTTGKAYDVGTTYTERQWCIYNNNLYVALQETTGNTPGETVYWTQMLDQIDTIYYCIGNSSSWGWLNGIATPDLASYVDFSPFSLDNTGANAIDASGIYKIKSNGYLYDPDNLDNLVFVKDPTGSSNNSFYNVIFTNNNNSNTIVTNCRDSEFGYSSSFNLIRGNFYENKCNTFQYNLIFNTFGYNTLSTKFSNNCINNFSDCIGFEDCQSNILRNFAKSVADPRMNSNIIRNSNSNAFGQYCYTNRIFCNTFQYNRVGSYFSYNGINCSGAFEENIIGNEFKWNDITSDCTDFQDNQIGNEFRGTSVSAKNIIADGFWGNHIEGKFGSSYPNTINGGFYFNTVANNYYHNTNSFVIQKCTFGSYCYYNTFYSMDKSNFGSNCYRNTFDSTFNGNDCASDFTYNHSLGSCNYNTFGPGAFQNELGDGFNYNTIGALCQQNTFGADCEFNQLGPQFSTNVIGTGFEKNVIGPYCVENIFGDTFRYNTIESQFRWNSFGTSCQYNKFGTNIVGTSIGVKHTYGNSFLRNVMKGRYGNGTACSIGIGCMDNVFGYEITQLVMGDNCKNNIFGDGLGSLTFGNDVRLNNFKNESVGSVNFITAGATHIYNYYDCEIYKRPDGSARLRYYDNTDTLVIALPTD